MIWLILWLTVGGISGGLGFRAIRKAEREARSIGAETGCDQSCPWMCLGISCVSGPLGPVWARFCVNCKRRTVAEATRMLTGPDSTDSLPKCLELKAAISAEIKRAKNDRQQSLDLVSQVRALLETGFDRAAAGQTVELDPTSARFPDQARLEEACQRIVDLDERLARLTAAAQATDDQIDNIRFGYEAAIEANDISAERLLLTAPDQNAAEATTVPLMGQPDPNWPDDAALGEKLGLPDRAILEHLIGGAKTHYPTVCFTRNPIGTLFYLMDNLKTAKPDQFLRSRGTICGWLGREFKDIRLALALSECQTPREAARLIGYRLEQAARVLSQPPAGPNGQA